LNDFAFRLRRRKGATSTIALTVPPQRQASAAAGASGTGFYAFQATSVAAAKTETVKKSGEAGSKGKGGKGGCGDKWIEDESGSPIDPQGRSRHQRFSCLRHLPQAPSIRGAEWQAD
jgi:hypothetical protein